MEKGKGLARRWAVELHDASSSSSSPAFPDPPGFTRSAPEADDAASARQRKETEAAWKGQKAWEVAQAPFKNLMMMGFMMWMAGSTVHLFSIGIVFSALWQPFNALRSVGKEEIANSATLRPFGQSFLIYVLCLSIGVYTCSGWMHI
ncbi:unnamed protein product [Triticum turgidum subsp. durum]|uniref:ER membrane protein complex subunit 4 n=1 Tax=Triticum turgidum subsp. durum TaxID=4567 RepID=A0A9R0T1K9_TRITD|nr:unnamed protein product [Triticum turgidum subsp. durum]